MNRNAESTDDPPRSMWTDVTRRRTLLGTAGIVAGSLAGCLGSGKAASVDSDIKCFDGSGDLSADQPLSAPIKGDPKADITVIAYEDFACPHCKEYVENVVPTIQKQYIKPGKVRYEHRDFPIPVKEPESYTAANAARAVQVLGGDKAFWVALDQLFAHQDSLGKDLYASLGKQTCLGKKKVKNAAANERYKETIREDRRHGRNKGVRATPTVLVNGSAVDPTVDAISAAIDSAN